MAQKIIPITSSGHTKKTPGDVFGKFSEYDLANKVKQNVVNFFKKENLKVVNIPSGKNVLRRLSYINKLNLDRKYSYFLFDIHINVGGKSGLEIWYQNGINNKKSKIAADFIGKEFSFTTQAEYQGSVNETKHELGGMFILTASLFPALVIEFLYLDSKKDQKILFNDKLLKEYSIALANSFKKYILS